MKIIVDVTKKAFVIKDVIDGQDVAIRTEVFVNGGKNYALQKILREDEFNSNFDIIWQYLGAELKEGITKESLT